MRPAVPRRPCARGWRFGCPFRRHRPAPRRFRRRAHGAGGCAGLGRKRSTKSGASIPPACSTMRSRRVRPSAIQSSGLSRRATAVAMSGAAASALAFRMALAGRVRAQQSDIVLKARIDADRQIDRLAGSGIVPWPCSTPVLGRFLRGREAEAFEIAVGELLDGAAAVPAVWRIVGLPEGMVPAQYGAVPAGVIGAGAFVQDGDVAQPWPYMGEALDGLPAPPGIGHANVGVEDDPQASH